MVKISRGGGRGENQSEGPRDENQSGESRGGNRFWLSYQSCEMYVMSWRRPAQQRGERKKKPKNRTLLYLECYSSMVYIHFLLIDFDFIRLDLISHYFSLTHILYVNRLLVHIQAIWWW